MWTTLVTGCALLLSGAARSPLFAHGRLYAAQVMRRWQPHLGLLVVVCCLSTTTTTTLKKGNSCKHTKLNICVYMLKWEKLHMFKSIRLSHPTHLKSFVLFCVTILISAVSLPFLFNRTFQIGFAYGWLSAAKLLHRPPSQVPRCRCPKNEAAYQAK